MNEFAFEVQGMTCQGCVKSITRAIMEADPDAGVEVDLDLKRVETLTRLNPDQIQAQIESAGFSASPLPLS
ncbi:MAG: hypothetical protein CVV27_02845 [Candidatus Melainabacteria bacterium HGW-Melainabacteria-1]|nr:MAG: hypothetical protein CVV27_02845 [Candidatus Melainabacteria bacterium HGW-Melainabacteria-1]